MRKKNRVISGILLFLSFIIIPVFLSGCSLTEGTFSGKDYEGCHVSCGMKKNKVESLLGEGEKVYGNVYQYDGGWGIGYRNGRVVFISLRGEENNEVKLPRSCYRNKLFGSFLEKIKVGETTVDDLERILGPASSEERGSNLYYIFVKTKTGGFECTKDFGDLNDQEAMEALCLRVILNGDTVYELQVSDLYFAKTAK